MGNETEKNQQNPGQRPQQSWKPGRSEPEESDSRAGSMCTTRRIRPRKSRARTAAQPSVRTVKDPRTSKSAAHPNRERDRWNRSHGEPAVAFCPSRSNLDETWPETP